MQERQLATLQPRTWWAGFGGVLLVAAIMSVRAYNDNVPDILRRDGFDKIAHFGFAGMLAFFLDGALRRRQLTVLGGIRVPLVGVILLGPLGVEEFLQRYTVYRTSSLGDFAADVAGVVVLVALSRRVAE